MIPGPRRSVERIGIALLLWMLGAVGCAEERVIGARGGLYGMAGAESGITSLESRAIGRGITSEQIVDEFFDGRRQLEIGEPIEYRPNRRKLDDGSILLISRSPRELIVHLFETAVDGEWELFYEQLLAEEAKDNYRQRERDPVDAVRFIRRHRTDFIALLRLMGSGEHTPGVEFRAIGTNLFRLHAPAAREFGQRFSTMEMVIENGRYVLLVVR